MSKLELSGDVSGDKYHTPPIARDMPEPYFQCICGTKAYPLTDDTVCDCRDIYDQEWSRHPLLDIPQKGTPK